MRSFKQWQLLNEMYGMTLGLGTKPSLGIVGAQLDEKKEEEGDEGDEGDEGKEKKMPPFLKKDKKDKKPPFMKKDDEEDKKDKKEKKPPFMKKDDEEEEKEDEKKEKKCPFMKKEDQDWWDSVQSQIGSDPNLRNWDGITTFEEEALLPPKDDNIDVSVEPKPGEFGFAPVGKIAWTQDLQQDD